jgi:serine/threonine protein kinase
MSTLAPLGAGSTVGGRYVLGSVLGRGGMAEVWDAQDTVLQRRVAVKLFRGDPESAAEEQRREAEIRLVAALSHPNLVTVFDAGTDFGCPGAPCTFLVMELVEGTTLSRLLPLGALSPTDVADLGAQMASALAYVHARGVVHRDLKPANILLASTPRELANGVTAIGVTAKLTDFGIARILDGARVTLTGTTVGTANYLSPEQASGADVSPASDVYSLGLVLLECLSGKAAFPGHGVEAAVARLQRAPAIPDDIDPAWQGLLATMTARDPAIRPSAATVANRLRAVGRSAASGPSRLFRLVDSMTTQNLGVRPGTGPALPSGVGRAHPSLPGMPTTRSAGRRRTVWLATAALVTAVLIAAILAVLPRGGSGTGTTTAPTRSYPSVSGKLGTDLRQLQNAVP